MLPDLTVTLDSPEATASFARSLAPALRGGDILLLSGEIGAGKSHFARALIAERLRATNQLEDIPSPTYTLVQTYDAGPLAIWHCDLYRLNEPDEAVELGLWDAFETALCLVEWPDRLGTPAPKTAATLHFAPGDHDDKRILKITAPDGSFKQTLVAILSKYQVDALIE